MPINPNDNIAGIPKSKIRKIFRFKPRIGVTETQTFGVEYLQSEFGVSDIKATEIIGELQQLGYLSQEPYEDDYYSVTEKGKLFSLEKANPPITTEKADELYAVFGKGQNGYENPDFIVSIPGFICLEIILQGTNRSASISNYNS